MSRTNGVCSEAWLRSLIHSTLKRTSALVNGSPFENVTPRRSLYSSVVGLIRFHDTASNGTYSPERLPKSASRS